MKDILSILRNAREKFRYRRWADDVITSYLPEKNGFRVLDVGCGKNIISKKPYVLGCDFYPVVRDSVGASAERLPFKNETFDLVVSAHCLEHSVNVRKVIEEWARVVKKNGRLWFILPHVDRTFDKTRELTSTAHILKDYEDDVPDEDRTHWDEFRDRTLLSGHPAIPGHYIVGAKNDDFLFFSSQKLIHHHVWNPETFCDLVECLGFRVLTSIQKVPGRDDSFSVVVDKAT